MMPIVHRLTESRAGRIALGALVVGLLLVTAYAMRSLFADAPEVAAANDRIFICSETGRAFHVNLGSIEGAAIPVYSPYSHKNTGYPAELCYWTADGGVKKNPTPVLLNSWSGSLGPTFCPDCGRLVVGHNPPPQPGRRPPPTQAEMTAQAANQGNGAQGD